MRHVDGKNGTSTNGREWDGKRLGRARESRRRKTLFRPNVVTLQEVRCSHGKRPAKMACRPSTPPSEWAWEDG